MSGAGGGLAGMNGGSFFKAPGWVDLAKRPGESRQLPPAWASWAKAVLKCGHVFCKPFPQAIRRCLCDASVCLFLIQSCL